MAPQLKKLSPVVDCEEGPTEVPALETQMAAALDCYGSSND